MAFPALFVSHPAPGAPDLAREVAGAFAEAGLDPVLDAQRGWDHGVWVPLRLLCPAADSEHFDPLLFVLGVRDGRDELESLYEGFRYGTLSLRSFALAAP